MLDVETSPKRKIPYQPTFGELIRYFYLPWIKEDIKRMGPVNILGAIGGVGVGITTIPYLMDSLSAPVEAASLNDIGGRGFGINSEAGGINLSWIGGTTQRGYNLLRFGSTGMSVIPQNGMLPEISTAHTTVESSTDKVLGYALLPKGSDGQPLGNSDLLFAIRGIATANAPGNFTLRLNESARATFTFRALTQGGLLIPLGGEAISLAPGTTNATHDTRWANTCYILLEIPSLERTDVLCGIPGLARFPDITSSLTPTPTRTATNTSTPTRTETATSTKTPEILFYTQTRTSFGIEFKAPPEVSSAAMDKAVQNFIDLTSHEPESRNRMITNRFGGYRVFGRNQKLTDLPEFSHLKGVYYNPDEPDPAKRILYDSFRGFANQGSDGVTALGEDILLDWPLMSIHEWAHPRLTYGFTEAQKLEWVGYYDLAKSRGLFQGTYAMNSRDEFWAESSASWRGDSQRVGFTPNDLNQIPGAYGFLRGRLGDPVPAPQTDQILNPRSIFKQPPVPGKDFI